MTSTKVEGNDKGSGDLEALYKKEGPSNDHGFRSLALAHSLTKCRLSFLFLPLITI